MHGAHAHAHARERVHLAHVHGAVLDGAVAARASSISSAIANIGHMRLPLLWPFSPHLAARTRAPAGT